MINIGVIGMGVMGKSHAQVYNKLPGVSVKAVCDNDINRAKEQAGIYQAEACSDYRKLLENPAIDAVSICLPDDLHVDATLAALKARKHILLEKPLADTLENGLIISEAVKNYERIFAVGYNMRFDPRYARLKAGIDSKVIGDIIYITSRRNSSVNGPMRFKGHSDLCIHVMVHDINMVNWFISAKPLRVFARSRDVVLHNHGMTDVIIALITYSNGVIVSMEASWVMIPEWPLAVDDHMEVVGTGGVIYVDGCGEGLRIVSKDGISSPDTRYRPIINGLYGGDLEEELITFLRAVEKGGVSVTGADEGIQDLQVVDAILRSINEGKETEIYQ